MPEKWVQQRACHVTELHLFFSLDPRDQRKAKGICVDCPVKGFCLEFALKHDEKGIWGGTSERQRVRIRIMRYEDSVRLANALRRNSIREQEHPSDASPSSLSYTSFQESRNLLASQKLAALQFPSSIGPLAS